MFRKPVVLTFDGTVASAIHQLDKLGWLAVPSDGVVQYVKKATKGTSFLTFDAMESISLTDVVEAHEQLYVQGMSNR